MIAAIGFGAWHQQSRVVNDFASNASEPTQVGTARDASIAASTRHASFASYAGNLGASTASETGENSFIKVFAFSASNPRSTN